MNDYWPETIFLPQSNGNPRVQVPNDSPELAIAVKNAIFDEISHALLELLLHMESLSEARLDL